MNTLILSSNSTDFITPLDSKSFLDEDKEYEAAFIRLETYNSIPNITSENNIFRYSSDKGVTWKNIVLPKDAYEYTQISDEIQKQMIQNGDYNKDASESNNSQVFYIEFKVCRLSSLIEILHDDYLIDFNCEHSIGPTLGFTSETLAKGAHKSPNIVDITKVNSILVNVNFVKGSYVNKDLLPVIYNFYPNVNPGYKIVEKANPLIYYPVKRQSFDNVRLWVTDQNGKSLDLQGECITVKIKIREVKKTKQQ